MSMLRLQLTSTSVNRKQFDQSIANALKALREVESRSWHSIFLASANPIDEGGEGLKLVKVAVAYKQFVREFADASIEARLEAYAILRAAYDNRIFPSRKHLSKTQFERLLMMHLERF